MSLKIAAMEKNHTQYQDEIPRRIIIIDDQEDILEILADHFSDDYWEVFTAMNGPAALSLMEQMDFSIALIDIKMPGMSGLELIERINKSSMNIKVILMTGDPSYETIKKGIEENMAYYLEKPFQKHDLLQKVDQVYRDMREMLEKEKNVSQLKQKVNFMRTVVKHLEESKKGRSNKIYSIILFAAIIAAAVALLWFSLTLVK